MTPSHDALRACPIPWCGGPALSRAYLRSHRPYWVECAQCGAATSKFLTVDEAVAQWNTRALLSANEAMAKVMILLERWDYLISDPFFYDPARFSDMHTHESQRKQADTFREIDAIIKQLHEVAREHRAALSKAAGCGP